MLTTDGVEITADMDLWDIAGTRFEPAARNMIDADPDDWAWQSGDRVTCTVWPSRSTGPWYSSYLASLYGKHARKVGQKAIVHRLMRRMDRVGKVEHAETLGGLFEDLCDEVDTLIGEILTLAKAESDAMES